MRGRRRITAAGSPPIFAKHRRPAEGNQGSRRRVVAANAAANLIRGASSSLLNLVLPLALIRMFSVQEYAVWVLIFSVSLYALYLDLGLVSSISTLVARAEAAGRRGLAKKYVAAGIHMITVTAIVLLAAYAAVAVNLGSLFPNVPDPMKASAGWALILLGGSQIAVLYSNVLVGYFVGLQRSRIPATITAIGKVGVFVVTVAIAATGAGLVMIAVVYFSTTTLYCLTLFAFYVVETRDWSWIVGWSGALRAVLALSGVLGVFSLCMLFISGLDAAVVARFAYSDLAPYGVAASLSTLVVGLFGALLAPLFPEFSRMAQQGRTVRVVDLLIQISEMLTQCLLGILGVLVVVSPEVLRLVAGQHLSVPAYPLTVLLLVAAVARTGATPLSVAIVALQDRRAILLAPALAETVVNITASIVLCAHIGAFGVAIGTIAGALTGVTTMFLVVVPRCGELDGRRTELFARTWLIPIIRSAPILIAGALVYYKIGPGWTRIPEMGVGGAIAAWLIWRSVRAGLAARSPVASSKVHANFT